MHYFFKYCLFFIFSLLEYLLNILWTLSFYSLPLFTILIFSFIFLIPPEWVPQIYLPVNQFSPSYIQYTLCLFNFFLISKIFTISEDSVWCFLQISTFFFFLQSILYRFISLKTLFLSIIMYGLFNGYSLRYLGDALTVVIYIVSHS